MRVSGWVAAAALFGCGETPDAFHTPLEGPQPYAHLPASDWGPYAVGVITESFTDPRGKDLVMEVWYPAQVEPPDTATDSRPPAARGRPLESVGAPYPLVAFSHGSSGIRYQSPFLTEYLASHGFVVVSPDHTRNTFLDNDPGAMVDVLVERPDDLRFSVDHLMGLSNTAGSFWTGWVGDGSYGVVGHSFGAFTALVLGGGLWSPEGVEPWCEDNAANSEACDLIGSLPEDVLDGHGGPDDRVAVTVAMAPGIWYGFGMDGEGLAEVRRPLLLGSDSDQILPYEAEVRPTYERLSPPRALLTFESAAHFAPYSNLCEFFPGFSFECAGPPEWVDPQWAQVQTRTLVTAWLREGLIPGAHVGDLSLLEPSAWGQSGVQLER